MQILWSHGWGFDPTFFNNLCQAMPEYKHFCIDWGYFNQPILPSFNYEKPLIGIGHSFGFAKILDLKLPLDGLISLGGFTRFCQSKEFKNGMPKRVLERMQNKFNSNPHQVLSDFRINCGYSIPLSLNTALDIELLRKDLQNLSNLNIILPEIPNLAIAGQNDRICSLEQQQYLFNNLKTVSGEHNFPVTQAIKTASIIQSFLQEL